MDQFGATNTKSTTFNVSDGKINVIRSVTLPPQPQGKQQIPSDPMRRP